nr:lamin tail domain-containing protein [Bacillus solimangrovi]
MEAGQGQSSNIFFSEYIEGSSYNKALEIYNGTDQTIDLSQYTIELSNLSSSISLRGTLGSGEVFVIANPNAESAILAESDVTDSNMVYNGDDSVTLKQNGTVIDVIGTAGTSFAKDKTLVRNSDITSGSSSYNSSEWTIYPSNTFNYIGSY